MRLALLNDPVIRPTESAIRGTFDGAIKDMLRFFRDHG
jgi:hypothetical protein